ncbi:MAG: DedA family protein [Planctomycetes bacterium]|nr:DedA family protein [Planctomycetota bacterium]
MVTLETVLGLLERYKYAAMFGILTLCGVGLPVPEEVTLIASGLAVGWEKADFWLASLLCVLGILAGDSIIFALGRYRGRWFLQSKPMRWLLTEKRQERIHRLFARHGRKAVFFARFFAGIRIGVYAYAGQYGMGWIRFLFLDLLGALVSGPTSIAAGAFVAKRIADPQRAAEVARDLVHRGSHWIYAGFALFVLMGVAHWLWGRRNGRTKRQAGGGAPGTGGIAVGGGVLRAAAKLERTRDREALPGA